MNHNRFESFLENYFDSAFIEMIKEENKFSDK